MLNFATFFLLRKNRERSIPSMLWMWLWNLSLSDILMSTSCIPTKYLNVMLQRWIFPILLCPIVNFAQLTSVAVSVWTLTAIGIDRSVRFHYIFCLSLFLFPCYSHHRRIVLKKEEEIKYIYLVCEPHK